MNRQLERRRTTTGLADPDMSDVLDGLQRKARDHARTPVQWDETEHAGFTRGGAKPWMRVNEDYKEGWNVEAEMRDPGSVWRFWKRALEVRKEWEVFVCLVYLSFLLFFFC